MLVATIEVKGLGKLTKQLTSIPDITLEATKRTTMIVAENIAGMAVSNLQSSIRRGAGELASRVAAEVDNEDMFNPVGRVRVNSPVGVFREFGTGPVGEASPKDLPEGVNPVYTQEPWFIPADQVDIDLTEVYGIPSMIIKGKKFYRTNGQPARPFLYPAFKQGVEGLEEVYKDEIRKSLRKEL